MALPNLVGVGAPQIERMSRLYKFAACTVFANQKEAPVLVINYP